LQKIFNTLIDSYIENKVGLSENFLSKALCAQLAENLQKLYDENKFRAAGTGNDQEVVRDRLFRSDKIFWLDRNHHDPFENDFFDLVDQFILHLNSTCYTGITGYEFHYTLYEKGSFYKRHIDQFRNDQSRQFSMIFYLNKDWHAADGGALSIYHPDHTQQVFPENGKAVFFKSDQLDHEVLVTNRPMSITGWLKTNAG
jgi:SM-20-related protein